MNIKGLLPDCHSQWNLQIIYEWNFFQLKGEEFLNMQNSFPIQREHEILRTRVQT